MKKKITLLLAVCMLLWLGAGHTVLAAVESRVQTAVKTAIRELKKDLHPEYSSKTYAYPKKRGYNKLNTEQKKLYRELYTKIKNFQSFSYSAKEYGYAYLDMIYLVWPHIVEDYPEIDNYFIIKEVDKNGIVASLDSRYYASWDQDKDVSLSYVKKSQKNFEETADYIVKKMPKNLSAYDKYRYLAYVISELTEYNYGESRTSDTNPYGALIEGKSICQGYDRAMIYLCRKANLYCVEASGSSGGDAHGWNLVKLSTGTYHVDITWADERGSIGSPQWMSIFMVTQSAIEADSHVVNSGSEATGKLNYNAALNRYTNIPEKGERYRDKSSGATYRVISANLESLQVEYYRPFSKKKTKLTIPRTVKINGNTFRVTRIASKAFQNNSKLKNLVIKTPYLKKVGADAFKGIHKNAQITVPKTKLSAYRSLLKNKGQRKTVKIVKQK